MTARRTPAPLVAGRPYGRRSTGTILTDLGAVLGGIPALPGAACKGRAEWFDLEPGADPALIERAEAICHACPVLDRCAAWLDSLEPVDRPSGMVAGQLLRVPPPRRLSEDDRPTRPPRPSSPHNPELVAQVAAWLAPRLAAGPVASAEIKSAAKLAGYGINIAHVAAQTLGVVSRRVGRQSWWALPEPGRSVLAPDRAVGDDQAIPHRSTSPQPSTETLGGHGQLDIDDLLEVGS